MGKIRIPIKKKNSPIYTPSGLIIAQDYERVVHGGRGDYIEIAPYQIVEESIEMPLHERWRVDFGMAYYIEFRSKDKNRVMIYYQTRLVSYADYKIGYYYVSPKEVITKDYGLNKYL